MTLAQCQMGGGLLLCSTGSRKVPYIFRRMFISWYVIKPSRLELWLTLIGVHVVHVPDRQVTHHILSSYSATPVVAASLLSVCQFVGQGWIEELIRLGSLPESNNSTGGVSLEQTFELPPVNKYRPGYSNSLTSSQKEPRVWEPNEERPSIFAEYRFLCVDEKGRELSGDFRELIERGGGSFETFDPNGGRDKLHKALARGQAKEGKKIVIVGKQASIQAAVGKEKWKSLIDKAKEYASFPPFVDLNSMTCF
jgi:hypothetical protein